MRDWCLYEGFAGSAALMYHLRGAKRSLMPYQGSKWRHRKALEAIIREHGFEGPPDRVVISEAGPWLRVHEGLNHPENSEYVTKRLQQWSRQDPKEQWNAIMAVPDVRVQPLAERIAQFLFLQRLAFSGKAVFERYGRWVSPGFNATSAYGKEATGRFGKINPMIPSLIRVLESYRDLTPCWVTSSSRACRPAPEGANHTGTVVYLDPPYARGTRYPAGHATREAVVAVASSYYNSGALVMVSEGEPVQELLDLGLDWCHRRIDKSRSDSSPFRGQQEEWVTYGMRSAVPRDTQSESPRST